MSDITSIWVLVESVPSEEVTNWWRSTAGCSISSQPWETCFLSWETPTCRWITTRASSNMPSWFSTWYAYRTLLWWLIFLVLNLKKVLSCKIKANSKPPLRCFFTNVTAVMYISSPVVLEFQKVARLVLVITRSFSTWSVSVTNFWWTSDLLLFQSRGNIRYCRASYQAVIRE